MKPNKLQLSSVRKPFSFFSPSLSQSLFPCLAQTSIPSWNATLLTDAKKGEGGKKAQAKHDRNARFLKTVSIHPSSGGLASGCLYYVVSVLVSHTLPTTLQTPSNRDVSLAAFPPRMTPSRGLLNPLLQGCSWGSVPVRWNACTSCSPSPKSSPSRSSPACHPLLPSIP